MYLFFLSYYSNGKAIISNIFCEFSWFQSGSVLPSTSLPQLSETTSSSAPPSPAKCRQRHQSLQHVPVITTEVYEDVTLPYNAHTRRNSSSYSATSDYDAVSYSGSGTTSLGILYRNRYGNKMLVRVKKRNVLSYKQPWSV